MIAQIWHGQLRPQAEAEGTPGEIIDFLAERALLSCPLGLAEMARHLLNCPDRTAELAALEQLPKLVSYGENDDAWPPEIQDAMADRLGAERVCIPGAAHSPAVEAPETTAAMLTRFWNQAESTSGPRGRSGSTGSRRRPGHPTGGAGQPPSGPRGTARGSRTSRTSSPALAGRRRLPGRSQARSGTSRPPPSTRRRCPRPGAAAGSGTPRCAPSAGRARSAGDAVPPCGRAGAAPAPAASA